MDSPITPSEDKAPVEVGAALFAAVFGMHAAHGAFEPYWLDAPELAAAVHTMGLPHPPGHPLYVATGKLLTLLPLGTHSFRVTLASALFSGAAAWLLFAIAWHLLRTVSAHVPRWITALLAAAVSLGAATSAAWWLQATRQEVYSLQLFVVLWGVYHLLRYVVDPHASPAHLWAAGLSCGIGMTNHHFIELSIVPAAIPAVIAMVHRTPTRQKWTNLAASAGFATWGLGLYALLPARSAAFPPVALGAVYTPSDMWWVVSAKVYQKSMLRQGAEVVNHSLLDALFAVMHSLGPVVVTTGVVGAYFLFRRRRTQTAGSILLLLALVPLTLRAIMGFDPYNPDFGGYILPAIAAWALLAGVVVHVTVHVLYTLWPSVPIAAGAMATACLAWPAHRYHVQHRDADLSAFIATRIFYHEITRTAGPHTAMLTYYFNTFFLLDAMPLLQGGRDDIDVVAPEFFGYPGYLAHITRHAPDLRPVAWAMYMEGRLTQRAVSDLALHRPVRVDPLPWHLGDTIGLLRPALWMYAAYSEPVATSDVRAAAQEQRTAWKRVYTRLGTRWKNHETWRVLAWYHYVDALFYAHRGEREAALWAIGMSKTIDAASVQINALEDTVRTSDPPWDIRAFFPGGDADAQTPPKAER